MLKKRLLIVQECPILPQEVFAASEWEIVNAETLEKAKRLLGTSTFDLLAAQLQPKSSALGSGVLELSTIHSLSAVVFCPSEKIDTISYQFRSAPILVLPLQTPRTVLLQVLAYLSKTVDTKRRLQGSINKEKRRFQDEKLVSQCKVQLVSLCRWSEDKAHQYILKTAMDHSMTKSAAARQIMRKLERIVNENQKNQCNASS